MFINLIFLFNIFFFQSYFFFFNNINIKKENKNIINLFVVLPTHTFIKYSIKKKKKKLNLDFYFFFFFFFFKKKRLVIYFFKKKNVSAKRRIPGPSYRLCFRRVLMHRVTNSSQAPKRRSQVQKRRRQARLREKKGRIFPPNPNPNPNRSVATTSAAAYPRHRGQKGGGRPP